MKTKMTQAHFQEKVLPLLRMGCKTQEELQAKSAEYVKDIELTDDEGNAVELTDCDLGEIETKSDEPEQGVTKEELGAMVKSAVAEAFKSQPKVQVKRPAQVEPEVVKVLPKRFGALKHFKGTLEGKNADERAFRFGSFCMAAMHKCLPHRFHSRGFLSAVKFCKDNGLITEWDDLGIQTKGQNETTNTQGGFLVPEEFSNDMIDLRLQYGVFRRNAKVIPMASDTFSRPRRTSGVTAYFVGEDAAGTESQKTWDRVSLTARKLMVLTRMSSEVNEDATINLGDDLAGEIAYAFANKEDDCGFNGDGTSTYGGMRGVRERLKTLNGAAPTTGSGLFLGTGNLYSELVLSDFNTVVSCCPSFARARAKWYASPRFYDSVMAKLQYAAGGVTKIEISEGVNQMFLGYPVELTEIMPTTEANSQVCVLFGDLGLAADFGDRRSNTIAFSDSALNAFEKDELIIRGTERFDINVHDIGTTSVGGPIVGLITAAS